MPDVSTEEYATSLQLVAEAIRQTADLQRDGIERLETKAIVLLGFVGTALPIYAAQDNAVTWMRILAFVSYGVAIGAGLIASRPYRHTDSPPPREFGRAFVAKRNPPSSVAKWLIWSRVQAYEKNELTAKHKAGCTWIALLAFMVAVAFSVASLWL